LSISFGKLDIILAACKASASSFDIPAFRNEVLGGACEGAREGVRPRDCETGTLFLITTLPGVGLADALLVDALDGVALDGVALDGVVLDGCALERLETPPYRKRLLEYLLRV